MSLNQFVDIKNRIEEGEHIDQMLTNLTNIANASSRTNMNNLLNISFLLYIKSLKTPKKRRLNYIKDAYQWLRRANNEGTSFCSYYLTCRILCFLIKEGNLSMKEKATFSIEIYENLLKMEKHNRNNEETRTIRGILTFRAANLGFVIRSAAKAFCCASTIQLLREATFEKAKSCFEAIDNQTIEVIYYLIKIHLKLNNKKIARDYYGILKGMEVKNFYESELVSEIADVFKK
ncbi:hypothetical protein Mgra_00006269 [Meloidogyne graminicola]|uniref:Uncharacterized protein n=1 Tax=Meloidogyne graminicola TaxID=189291 RepID=A0A8S9ZLZ5_9BILA|nr:hypothetical protein Mgra_00006269 [Meloidogyne graminicola]